MNILAIESSCDETAVAVVRDGREVLTDCISSQVELLYRFFRLFLHCLAPLLSRKTKNTAKPTLVRGLCGIFWYFVSTESDLP